VSPSAVTTMSGQGVDLVVLQVLETGVQHDEREPVICVSWAPANGPSVGHLAATAGSRAHLFSPTTFSSSSATAHSAPGTLLWLFYPLHFCKYK
jgi:hypothetical protein